MRLGEGNLERESARPALRSRLLAVAGEHAHVSPSPKVIVCTSRAQMGSSSRSPAGTIAVPPPGRAAISSALAAAIASMLPAAPGGRARC